VHDLITVKSRYVNDKKEKFIIGFITDITHLKKAEENISELNANLQGIIESTKESIYAVDSNFRYISFNQNHKRIMKALYGSEISIGTNKLAALKRSKDRRWIEEELNKALQGNHFLSEHFIKYPKFTGYIQTTYNPIRDKTGQVRGAAVFVNDVTQRRQFEEIIKAMNARLSSVLESSKDHVLAVDKNLRYIMFNQAHADGFKKLFNTTIKNGKSFLDGITPEIQKIAKREMGKALRGKQFNIEEQLVKDIIFEVSLNPIRNEMNEVTGVAIFARDITQRKKIQEELKVLNDELVEQNRQLADQEEELKTTLDELSERNFELDQLMYKTSHDLRSPLSSIMGLVNLANLDKDPGNHISYLHKIEGRIKKLDEFISSMLDYARVNRVEVTRERVNLREVASNCIHELEYLENFKDIKTEVHVKGDHALFTSDMLRLNIIFSNIISNAYKYYNPEVESYLKIKMEVNPFIVRLEFKDNGIGIKSEHRDKIFNMFYRATDRSQGSGLGMYIVKQAVEKLNGDITIDSEYGKGTKIKISLPNL
jgi:PAS domain S-box-containing protein